MSNISFQKQDENLIMFYFPEYGFDNIDNKIQNDSLSVKNIFHIKRKNLLDNENDEEYSFIIGKQEGDYYKLDKEVFLIDNNFYFHKDIEIKEEMFIAYSRISIICRIDRLIKENIYITKDTDDFERGHISINEYYQLIKSFPNTTELKKYSESRVSRAIGNFINTKKDYNLEYEKYLNKHSQLKVDNTFYEIQKERLKLFSSTKNKLEKMLVNTESYVEKDWQEQIVQIVNILYPKYIIAKREVDIGADGRHRKRPDFILVDSYGFVDVLEIKKPNNQKVITNSCYRNNYIADRDLEGAIVQLEKCIYTLNYEGNTKAKNIEKLFKNDLPVNVHIKFVNPQGMLLMGRSDNLNNDQLLDFEVIKRQHKNIVDIMTYDDLLERLNNIINSLKS
ncbi:MAG: DUF4263 domain-containing protein [Lachnospiraceae bacterium]|nr:DUF4263 domain-containing protein [Lachnospiraceae bacterium]